MGYSVAVAIFCIGVILDLCVVYYIIHGNRKYKNIDPFADEQ